MNKLTQILRPVQNLGLADRILRAVAAVMMTVLPLLDLNYGHSFSWHGYVILLGIYPALTTILGWDPFYALFSARSCGTSRRNQCGTFPYEVDAALGHNPIPDENFEYDHSLSASHHR